METPGNLRKDGYQLLEQAQEIAAQAISEKRSLTIAETALIEIGRAHV